MLKISKKAFELFKETEKSAPGSMENKLLLDEYYYNRGVEAGIKKNSLAFFGSGGILLT